MTPAARLQATIEILGELERSALPADRFIRAWFRARHYAGSKDRASVIERVFAILRRRASLAWRMRDESPRAITIASVLADGGGVETVTALFSGDGYGPAALSADEHAAISSPPQSAPPLSTAGDFPVFLEGELVRSLGEGLLAEMAAMWERAPVDLRVNTLKAEREHVLAELRAQGLAAEPTLYSPHGIRIVERQGTAALRSGQMFTRGLFEPQDEAAQIAALLCGAKQGESILELAAGAGGKSLILASEMKNAGRIVACDVNAGRLRQIGPRAARAGVSIIEIAEGAPPLGPFDAVFVDAPCSGTGVWRRQPELKWRITAQRLGELNAIQDELLAQAAMRVRPGGRIVYATCSMLMRENEDRIAQFLAVHPEFAVTPVSSIWCGVLRGEPTPSTGRYFKVTPRSAGTDGFFAAVLVRQA